MPQKYKTVREVIEELQKLKPEAAVMAYCRLSEDGDAVGKIQQCLPSAGPYCKGAHWDEWLPKDQEIVIIG